jgi:hypothetical protein
MNAPTTTQESQSGALMPQSGWDLIWFRTLTGLPGAVSSDLNELFEETSSRRKQVEALRDVAWLANLQFAGGVIDFFQVLDAERSLFEAQLSLVQNGADALISLISVYSAMGGGWITQADSLADSLPAR